MTSPDALPARWRSRAALLWMAIGLAGCAAGKASLHLVSAESALSRATSREAGDRAPYEYTMAVRYLTKAREEFGEADYRTAEALSRASATWADRAIITLEQKGPTIDVGGLSDDRVAEPAPEVAPTPAPAPVDPLFEPSAESTVPGTPEAAAEPAPEPPPEEKGEFDELENLDIDDEEIDPVWGPK